MKLVYKHEPTLFFISFAISLAVWGSILYELSQSPTGLFVAIPVLIVAFIAYLFAQSGFISHFKGTGALISAQQFPDLDARLNACAQKLDMKKVPTTYLVNGNGVFNAFATHFLRSYYVVLLSNVIDALQDNPDGLNFYIGHEFGHIRRKHLLWHTFLLPSSILPLLGAGYHRAREYTCDKHGLACCENAVSAAKALAVLAVGRTRWKDLNLGAYVAQTKMTKGFWMSFHELVSSYPWLTKRLARISPQEEKIPRRNVFAYIPAIFVPRPSIETIIVIYLLIFAIALPGAQKMIAVAQMKQHAAISTTPPGTMQMYDQNTGAPPAQ